MYLGHYSDFEEYRIVKWTTREPGPDTATYPGLKAACMRVVLDDNGQIRVLFGNSNGNGKLYESDSGTSDAGSSIYMDLQFKGEHFEDLRNEKLYGDITVRARTGSSATAVNFYTIRNLSGVYDSVYSETLSSSGFVFGTTSRLGIDAFGGDTISTIIVPVQDRAGVLGFAIRQTDTSSFQLLDFVMTAIP